MSVIPDSHRDLAQANGIGVLTSIGPSGSPQSTAVGFLFDGEAFRISTSDDKQKVKNLAGRPQCSLFIADAANAYHTLEVRGRAEVLLDDDFEWAKQIAEANGGTVDDVRRIHPAGAHRVCVVVHPAKAVTFG